MQRRLNLVQVLGAVPTPFKGQLVVWHLNPIEFHGAHQRRLRPGHAALLPGVAQQQGVGVDGIPQRRHRHVLGIERDPGALCPTAAAKAASQPPRGNCHCVSCTNAAVGVAWVLSATKVRPSCITASVALLAATMASQPITRSALATSTLLV